MSDYEAKDYIVIDQNYISEDGSSGRGLLIGEFDTFEEAEMFVNNVLPSIYKRDFGEPNIQIFGPRQKEDVNEDS